MSNTRRGCDAAMKRSALQSLLAGSFGELVTIPCRSCGRQVAVGFEPMRAAFDFSCKECGEAVNPFEVLAANLVQHRQELVDLADAVGSAIRVLAKAYGQDAAVKELGTLLAANGDHTPAAARFVAALSR